MNNRTVSASNSSVPCIAVNYRTVSASNSSVPCYAVNYRTVSASNSSVPSYAVNYRTAKIILTKKVSSFEIVDLKLFNSDIFFDPFDRHVNCFKEIQFIQ